MRKFLMMAALGVAATLSAYGNSLCASLVDASFTTGTYDVDNGTGVWSGAGTSCSVGGYTFSNFAVYGQAYGAGSPGIQLNFQVVGNSIQIGGTNLGTNDIEVYYTVTSGLNEIGMSAGPGVNVTEEVCGIAYGQSTGSESCSSPLNLSNLAIVNGNPSQVNANVTVAPVDYIVVDDSGGSQFTQVVIPEPMTLSLLGAGLLGLGLLGRKIRK